MSVDVEELQMFDGIAVCANHIVNFRIGKLFQKKTLIVELTNFQICLGFKKIIKFNYEF